MVDLETTMRWALGTEFLAVYVVIRSFFAGISCLGEPKGRKWRETPIVTIGLSLIAIGWGYAVSWRDVARDDQPLGRGWRVSTVDRLRGRLSSQTRRGSTARALRRRLSSVHARNGSVLASEVALYIVGRVARLRARGYGRGARHLAGAVHGFLGGHASTVDDIFSSSG